jgi:hypothetical protein
MMWRRVYTLGRIADLLADRGELDEALRIRREEVLPAYEQLGDVRSRAHTLGRIADALVGRGERARGLKMWREALGVFERLGEPRMIETARRRITQDPGDPK